MQEGPACPVFGARLAFWVTAMNNRRRALSVSTSSALVLLVLSMAPLACKKEDATPAAPPTVPAAVPVVPAANAQSFENIRFEAPVGWKLQAGAPGIANIVGPQDGDWEPNISFRTYENKTDRSVDEILSEALERLAPKPDFESKGKQSEIDHPGGFQYGRIGYLSKNDVTNQIALFQWYVVIPLPNKRWLELQASTTAETRAKYEGVFQKVIDSIRVTK